MPVKIKSKKELKRELVVPFIGEENFVVPKKGGFGQPDNEHFVMAIGDIKPQGLAEVPNIDNIASSPISKAEPEPLPPVGVGVGGSGLGGIDVTPPTLPILPVYKDYSIMPCSELTTYLDYLNTFYATASSFGTELSNKYINEISGVKSAMVTKSCNVLASLPVFPDWNTLDCAAIEQQILSIENTMAQSRFSLEIANAYNMALANAKSAHISKCEKTIMPTPLPRTVFGGAGGGVSDLGTPPVAESIPTPANKKSNTWIWLLLGVGALYLFTRKSNS